MTRTYLTEESCHHWAGFRKGPLVLQSDGVWYWDHGVGLLLIIVLIPYRNDSTERSASSTAANLSLYLLAGACKSEPAWGSAWRSAGEHLLTLKRHTVKRQMSEPWAEEWETETCDVWHHTVAVGSRWVKNITVNIDFSLNASGQAMALPLRGHVYSVVLQEAAFWDGRGSALWVKWPWLSVWLTHAEQGRVSPSSSHTDLGSSITGARCSTSAFQDRTSGRYVHAPVLRVYSELGENTPIRPVSRRPMRSGHLTQPQSLHRKSCAGPSFQVYQLELKKKKRVKWEKWM